MQNIQPIANENQSSLRAYHKNLVAIYKERRKIMHEINDKQREKKFLNAQDDLPKFGSYKSQTHLYQQPRKLVKTEFLSNNSIGQDHPQKPSTQNQQNQQNKKNNKPVAIPQAIADRNRRIFGGLTSYLKKAGQYLQSQVEKQKQQNSKSILNKFISKEKQQRQEQELRKKELIQNQLKKLQEQKKENQAKMNKAENQMLSYIVKSHFNAIGKFYLTKTQPKLFWKPKKTLEDQEKLQKLKHYAEKQLKKQQQEFVDKIMSYTEVFDHGKYMTQNQRQFYQSTIKNMFINHENFILTKTEPNVFWKPRKCCKEIESLLADTSMKLNEKSVNLKAANQQYYKTRQGNFIDEHNKQYSDEDQQYDEERN